MTKLEQAARQALGALEVATTPLAKDRQEVLRAITTLREALSEVQALSAAPVVPAGWKAVPVNPTPEMWKAAKTVPDPNPPYPPHYGLVWDAMLAASPTPPAEQQAAPKAAQGELSADSLRHQNKLLAETLGACILASGIVRKDIDGFTGPELLHFGEDLRSMLASAPQQEAQEPAPKAAPAAQGDARAEQPLLKVLTSVQRYLPPDGPSAKDTLAEIIGIVDPWPLGELKGKA